MRRAPAGAAMHRHLLLLPLFFVGGCAALIYQIVWFQLLEFVIGSSAVSLAVLLGAYMGGMCLGSLLLPRALARLHPLRAYALIEAGIGACGAAVLYGIPQAARLYTQAAGHGLALRGAACAACLLLPAMLMGATLPVVARAAGTAASLGLLYGANIAGAVSGCLLAGFYLLRVFDTPPPRPGSPSP